MYSRKLMFQASFMMASLSLVLGLPMIAFAKGTSSPKRSAGKASSAAGRDSQQKARRGRQSEVAQLRAEMDALHDIIAEQRQALNAIQKRLDSIQGGASGHVTQVSPSSDSRISGAALGASGAAAVPASSTEPGSDVMAASNTPVAPPVARDRANNMGEDLRDQSTTPESGPPSAAGPGAVRATSSSGSSARPQGKSGFLAGWGDDHAFIRNESGSFETDFAGYSQLDFRGYGSGMHPPNTFVIRRARMAMEGRIDRYFEWRIEGDFADTSSTLLRDFYVNIHRIDEFAMRFGQTRQPFSQEEMRSDNLQEFVERSLANNLAPSRSPGLMAYGSLGRGLVEYQIGAFNGKGLLARNNNGTPDTALRLRFSPWKHSDSFWLKGLIIGGAYNQGRNLNSASIRGLTAGQIVFFQPDTVNGRVYRANGEVTWLVGPATLRAEYDQSNQLRQNLGPRGANLPGVIAKGYMAQFTYALTGESKPDIGYLVPRRNLFDRGADGRTGLGAWELKFRYDNLQINDGTSKSNRADTFYFGPNWYMNKYVRYMLDIGIERFKNPATAPRPGQNFFTVLSRVQLQL